jgi:hypothetical protein
MTRRQTTASAVEKGTSVVEIECAKSLYQLTYSNNENLYTVCMAALGKTTK